MLGKGGWGGAAKDEECGRGFIKLQQYKNYNNNNKTTTI